MSYIKPVESLIHGRLEPYLKTMHHYTVAASDDRLEILAQKSSDDGGYFTLLQLSVNAATQEMKITKLYLPEEDRKKAIGMGLIGFIYKLSRVQKCTLVLENTDLSFREAMLKRGAATTNVYDRIQIVDGMKLE